MPHENREEMALQLSILTIAGYGPWTLTLGSDREHELQMLQASIYCEVQRLFSERGCLAFANRSDEIVALSTGLRLKEHADIQDALASKFEDVQMRIAIGRGSTPAEADRSAQKSAGSSDHLLDEGRMIYGPPQMMTAQRTGGEGNGQEAEFLPGAVIMHLDIDGLSCLDLSPYETSLLMLKLHRQMSAYFYDCCGSLTFFMGGDNFMVISSEPAKRHADTFLKMAKDEAGVQLNCGIGSGNTAREAAQRATESLDMIRKMRDEASGGSTINDHKDGDTDAPCPYPRVYEHATGISY